MNRWQVTGYEWLGIYNGLYGLIGDILQVRLVGKRISYITDFDWYDAAHL